MSAKTSLVVRFISDHYKKVVKNLMVASAPFDSAALEAVA